MTLAAPWLIDVLYGQEYTGSVPILQIHVWAGVFIFPRAAFSKWLIAERLLVFSLVTQGAGAVVNIGANMFLDSNVGRCRRGLGNRAFVRDSIVPRALVFPATRPAAMMMARTIAAPLGT